MRKTSLILAILFLITLSVFTAMYLYNDADKLSNHYVIYNLKEQKYELVKKKPESWIELRSISKQALWAIIVSEDWAFYDHPGIDLLQIKEAIEDKIVEGDKIRGASTISQQVVKNAFYSNKRSYIRKLKEVIATFKLENNLSKNQILEQYINLIELGKNLYGVRSAAKLYFNKHPKDLTAKEGAFLAMLLPSPIRYSQSYRDGRLSDYAKKTVDKILTKLKQAQIITEKQRLIETARDLSFEYN